MNSSLLDLFMEESMQGVVYKVQNKVTGKIYVGQTTKTISQRWTEHVYDSIGKKSKDRGSYLHEAVRKYGPDNFDISVLNLCCNKEALDSVETFYIKELNTVRPNGYNISLGGAGVMHGRKMSPEAKKKISDGLKRAYELKIRVPNKEGRTEEFKKRISESLIGNKRSVGRKHSEETKLKMSLSHIGRKYKKRIV